MARRKSTASKLQPAVRYLRYELTNSGTPGTETSHYIDLAKDLSAVNRRLYRQGRDYHVKRISVTSSNTISGMYPGAAPGTANQQNAGRFSVSSAPDSWVARGAWKRGFQVWQQMNKEAMGQLSGNIQGTWADFKIWMTADFAGATLARPMDNGGDMVDAGEWDISTFVTPDGTATDDEFYATLMGAHVGAAGARTSISLIRSYGESRATVQADDPSVPSTASADPLVNVFDYGTTIDDVVDLLEDQNDSPPYHLVNYPGGAGNMPKPLVVHETTLGAAGKAVVPSFNALLGQLEFEISSPIASDVYSVLVELAPGKYRGIKAEAI
jgi:hypothetical protein